MLTANFQCCTKYFFETTKFSLSRSKITGQHRLQETWQCWVCMHNFCSRRAPLPPPSPIFKAKPCRVLATASAPTLARGCGTKLCSVSFRKTQIQSAHHRNNCTHKQHTNNDQHGASYRSSEGSFLVASTWHQWAANQEEATPHEALVIFILCFPIFGFICVKTGRGTHCGSRVHFFDAHKHYHNRNSSNRNSNRAPRGTHTTTTQCRTRASHQKSRQRFTSQAPPKQQVVGECAFAQAVTSRTAAGGAGLTYVGC